LAINDGKGSGPMRRQIKEPRPSRWLVRENQMSKVVRWFSLASVTALSLIAASPATAKELQFQGGDEPFDGQPSVGMTMTGPDFEKPKRVTGFSITGWTWTCGQLTYPADLETAEIHNDPNPTVAKKGIKIKTNEKKDRYFKWTYELKGASGTVFERFFVLGGQHRKHPRVWRGKFKVQRQEGGIQYDICTTDMDDEDGFIRWEAKGIN
jgi:hypothetical protein